MKKIQILAVLTMSALCTNSAFAVYNFNEKIQMTEFGELAPSARGLVANNRTELQRNLVASFVRDGAPAFAGRKVAILNLFLDSAIAEQALKAGDRQKALDLLNADEALTVATIQREAGAQAGPAAVGAAGAAAGVAVPAPARPPLVGPAFQPVAPRIPAVAPQFQALERARNSVEYFAGLRQIPVAQVRAAVRATLPHFWMTHPTTVDVIALITQIGLTDPANLEIIMEIKRQAIYEPTAVPVVTAAEDYNRLFAEIIPNAFHQNDAYYIQNTVMILSNLRDFLGRPDRNRADFNTLRVFLMAVPLHPDFVQNREATLQRLHMDAPTLKPRVQRQAMKRFRDHLVALYNQVRPTVNPTSRFQFYLLRNDVEFAAAELQMRTTVGESIMGEEFTEAAPGIQCPFHPAEHPAAGFHPADLPGFVQAALDDNVVPVNCGAVGRGAIQHEMMINSRQLIAEGMDRERAYDWELRTLMSYHNKLLELQREAQRVAQPPYPDHRICKTAECNTIVVAADRNADGSIRCPQCETTRCYLCEHAPHAGQTCEQALQRHELPDYHKPELRIRPCPYCGTPADKNDNCNSVVCTVCHQEWHFVNGIPRLNSLTHDFNNGRIVPPRTYRVPGDLQYNPALGDDQLSGFPVVQGALRNVGLIRRGANRYQP